MTVNDKTIEEIAARWNVSPRYVQYLCKQGKIPGATKRAGVWFVPSDTPTPVKNNKSNATHFEFVGTKKKVFNNAVLLYMKYGFENVSMRDVAEATGIRQSAMYNHFSSKQQILQTIYDFYNYCYLLGRPSAETIEELLSTGTIDDIVNCTHYDFAPEYQGVMESITKILFQRSPVDSKARELIKTLMLREGIRYVEELFNHAVEMGRFAPMDTRAISIFINSVRLFTLHNWIVDSSPENMRQVLEDEKTLYSHVSKFITDLGPLKKAN